MNENFLFTEVPVKRLYLYQTFYKGDQLIGTSMIEEMWNVADPEPNSVGLLQPFNSHSLSLPLVTPYPNYQDKAFGMCRKVCAGVQCLWRPEDQIP